VTNTTNDNILNVMYNNSRILIDKLTEYDYNGDMATVKKMCTVVRYDKYSDGEEIATPMTFNVSPYTGLMDMHTMARTWIDCGCPTWDGSASFPRKWTKESLHAWAAG
jgi:hypothetical protein